MSFAADVKTELCRLPLEDDCCMLAEAYGMMLFGNTFTPREIRIVTEHLGLAARLPDLFWRTFHVTFDVVGTTQKQVFGITEPDKVKKIRGMFGYDEKSGWSIHLNNAALEEPCCRAAFLRGVFFTGGSLTDPNKKYHLELASPYLHLSREVCAVLQECGFEPKTVRRSGHHVLYFKQSEAIEDFLTTVGAPLSTLRLMESKVEKDLRNTVNRRVNCETANLTKTVSAAMQQIEAIGRLQLSDSWDKLPEALQETAEKRILYPEDTLLELAERFAPPLGRSALNHRLRRLVELSRQKDGIR